MEHVHDGVIIKDDETLSSWFDKTNSVQVTTVGSPEESSVSEEITTALNEYEDEGIKSQELSRMKENMVEVEGVSQQMRSSMETYISEEDETLPSVKSYTGEFSKVNYDVTLAWTIARQETSELMQIKRGVKFNAMALHWLAKFGVQNNKGENLDKLVKKARSAEEKVMATLPKASMDPDLATAAVYTLFSNLEVDHEMYETSFEDTPLISAKKKRILSQLITPVIGPTLNALTIDIGFNGPESDHFNIYQQTVKKMIKEITKTLADLPNGKLSEFDLSKFEGGIDHLNSDTKHFTLLINNVGMDDLIDMKYVNAVLDKGYSTDKLLQDNEDYYVETWMKLRDDIASRYNLDNLEDTSDINVDTPDQMLRTMNENNKILSSILDAVRCLASVYNALVETAVAKNNLMVHYSVFLSSLTE